HALRPAVGRSHRVDPAVHAAPGELGLRPQDPQGRAGGCAVPAVPGAAGMGVTPPPRRIGLYGGAFDPPHEAHRAMAEAALAQLGLDLLLILPTGQAWHKSRPLTAAAHRLAMSRLAFSDLPHTRIDDREMRRNGPTYTV